MSGIVIGMNTLLIRHAHCVATFDEQRSELRDASILIRGHRIEAIGAADQLPAQADEVIDARGHLVLPGLVNTHHHMYQSLTRAIPGVLDAELFSWLRGLYPIWAGLTPEMVQVSTQLAMAELLLSGCTTSSEEPPPEIRHSTRSSAVKPCVRPRMRSAAAIPAASGTGCEASTISMR